MNIRIGHPEAHEKLTAKLFWKKVTENGYNDAGNVKEFVDATSRTLVTRTTAENGSQRVNDEQVGVNHEAYTFLLDERNAEQEKLISLARQLTDLHQGSSEGATSTIQNAALGKWYPIGAYSIQNLTVTASESGELVEGTDYEVDLANGRIHVLDDATIDDRAEDLVLLWDQANNNFQQFESNYDALFYCDLIVEEYNQYSQVWLRRRSFRGYLNVTEFPTQSGEFGTYRVKATPSGRVTYYKRPTAETLTEPSETLEGPAHSSSSQSSSSGSQSSKSSSSSSSGDEIHGSFGTETV